MNQIDLFLFQLLKNSLFPDRFSGEIIIDESMVKNVYAEMKAQTIEALPEKWVKGHPIADNELNNMWFKNCMAHKGRWVQVMAAQKDLLSLLNAHGIKCVIIKGAAAAMAYPYPELRSMGDVDFLVARKDYEKAANILEANGYQLVGEKVAGYHHYEYCKDGVMYELHRRLAIVSETNEELLLLFENGIEQREFRTIYNYSFPVLPPKLNGLVLLFHINQHLRSGLGLRQIIDWMMYLHENEGFKIMMPKLQELGMERFANTVTVMCQKYLGLETYVEDTGDYLCEELLEYIMLKGNFGRKGGNTERIASVFLDVSNPIRLFKRLQKGGCLRWKAARKHIFLKPFAWIYQIGFIINQLLKSRITPLKMRELQHTGYEQRNLIAGLGLNIERTIKGEH